MTTKTRTPGQASYAQLDPSRISPMLGADIEARLNEAWELLKLSHYALYLIGPSGSGKTHFGKVLGKRYAQAYNVPLYYLQMDRDVTKTTAIYGFRIINGSYIPVKGVVGQAMEEGAFVIVDEALHTFASTLLMFNSILERDGLTAIGDDILYNSPLFKVLFISNDDLHVGNVRLPQSFAQRLMPLEFDYPSWETETEVAWDIATREVRDAGEHALLVERFFANYATSYVREVRKPEYPLSARNAAQALLRLHVAAKLLPSGTLSAALDPYFSQGHTASLNDKIGQYLFGGAITNTKQLLSPEMEVFKRFVSALGVERFRDILLLSCGYKLPVDGFMGNRDKQRQDMKAKTL